MSAIVLGIGNVLLSDEGIGIRTVVELERLYNGPDNLEILDGGTAGIELLRFIAGKDLLIIVDAMQHGHTPGTIFRVEGEDVPKTFMTKVSPHQIGLSDLLAAGILTDELPTRMVLFGIEPESLETGLVISKPIIAILEKLVTAIADELTVSGYPMVRYRSPRELHSSFWPE